MKNKPEFADVEKLAVQARAAFKPPQRENANDLPSERILSLALDYPSRDPNRRWSEVHEIESEKIARAGGLTEPLTAEQEAEVGRLTADRAAVELLNEPADARPTLVRAIFGDALGEVVGVLPVADRAGFERELVELAARQVGECIERGRYPEVAADQRQVIADSAIKKARELVAVESPSRPASIAAIRDHVGRLVAVVMGPRVLGKADN